MKQDVENQTIELFEKLYSMSPEEYWKQDIPSALDNYLLSKIESIVLSDFPVFVEFVSLLKNDKPAKTTLGIFSNRMASYAVRITSREVLKTGLKVLSATLSGDMRDNLITISLYHHSARKIGVDANVFFVETASELGATITKSLFTRKLKIDGYKAEVFEVGCNELVAFSQRKPGGQSIEAMCYEESTGLGGFLYRPDSSWR